MQGKEMQGDNWVLITLFLRESQLYAKTGLVYRFWIFLDKGAVYKMVPPTQPFNIASSYRSDSVRVPKALAAPMIKG